MAGTWYEYMYGMHDGKYVNAINYWNPIGPIPGSNPPAIAMDWMGYWVDETLQCGGLFVSNNFTQDGKQIGMLYYLSTKQESGPSKE
jgi:hypothetical protein